jgi:hypothetical protein
MNQEMVEWNIELSAEFSRYLFEHPELEEKIPILFPMHPRTRKQVRIFGMESAFDFHPSPDCPPNTSLLFIVKKPNQ